MSIDTSNPGLRQEFESAKASSPTGLPLKGPINSYRLGVNNSGPYA